MSQSTFPRIFRPVPVPAWRWTLKPIGTAPGFLLIGETLYRVSDEAFEYDNGRAGRLVKLSKSDGTTYQLTLDADDDLQCDCPDQTYRGGRDPEHRCKHAVAVQEAFAELERSDRLAQWLANNDPQPAA